MMTKADDNAVVFLAEGLSRCTDRDGLVEQIIAIFQTAFPDAGVLTSETHLTEDIAVDSVRIMELLMALEDQYDTEIPLNELADVQTIGDLASMLWVHIAPAVAADTG